MGNSRSLVASCQERPSWGQIALSSADPAGNICHMAQLRTHKTALPVSNSFSDDWIFPPSLSSVEKRRSDYGLRKSNTRNRTNSSRHLYNAYGATAKSQKKTMKRGKKSGKLKTVGKKKLLNIFYTHTYMHTFFMPIK